MKRRTFLNGMMAAGFLGIMEAGASPLIRIADAAGTKKNGRNAGRKGKTDDNLVVFISDLHTNPDGYQPEKLKRVVSDILAMSPLPGNVIALGDLAYHTGKPREYEALKPILAPIEDAGITITLGLGNHDRREEFREAFPQQAEKSVFNDRLVYVVDTPNAEFIVLDSLQEGEDKTTWITPGALNSKQVDWLDKRLEAAVKPVFVCSHHPLNETGISGILSKHACCSGYIFGHSHRWMKYWTESGRALRTLCLPSTGHWGDIGYVEMHLNETTAVATVHEYEFFFTSPVDSSKAPSYWEYIAKDNDGEKCTFTLK